MYRRTRLLPGLLLGFASFFLVSVAHAETEGMSLPGTMGIRERNADIAARQAKAPPVHERPEHELEYPDRSGLPQNPGAPLTSRFPQSTDQGDKSQPTRNIHSTALSFDGPNLSETGAFPPDTMGAVGPTQFGTFVNGRLRSFTKAGVADGVLNADPDVFFASVMTPVAGAVLLTFTSDPQVRYDRFTGRWFISIIDVPCTAADCSSTAANRWLLAVSDASSTTLTGSTVWTFFQFQGDATGNFFDYPSLGIDVNALYTGGNMFSPAGSFVGTNGYVIQKSSVLGAGPIKVTAFANLAAGTGAGPFSPRGVDNMDPAATEGYIVGIDNATFSTISFRRVSNPGSVTPTISSNITITVPTTTTPNPVEHAGNTGGNNGRLDSLDDRLFAAMARNGRLWTAHNFRMSTAGVASTTSTARNGTRWYELQNLTTTPTLVQSGSVFDNAATRAAARQYFIPSVTVTGQGHSILGFTMAGVVGATPAYVGRLAGDTLGTMVGPPTVAAVSFGTTTGNYNPASDPGGASGRRWGDYSFTSVDPLDEMTVWTVQEYNQAANSYAVRVARLAAPPPATPTCSGSPISFSGPTGNVVVNATSSGGTGFFDPGANLPAPALAFKHISATMTNAVVNSVTYNSPTQVTLNVTASVAGLQDVVITNPDGQSVTAVGCVNVSLSGVNADLSITKTDGVTTATPGGSVTYTVTAGNAGPNAATGATVADTFPASLTCTWTCVGAGGGTCAASGVGNINDTVNLPNGASVTYTASCSISAAATGTLSNTATVTAPAGVTDPTPGNNSATDSDTLAASADLAITKTDGVTTATAGGSVTYTIAASNAGPSNAPGATVADTFPASETCTWTCVGAGGGTCTASGSGNINNTVNLPSGGSVTYTASCAVSAAATGTLSNTATVSAPGGVTDPTPCNNSATDSDTLTRSADVAVSISDARQYVMRGETLNYSIVVANAAGPSQVQASVLDALPAELASGSWVCTPTGSGAACAAGTGNTLSDTATLPPGTQVTYVYSAVVQPTVSETIVNSASASLTGGASDPVPGNNSATDSPTDIVVIYRDGFEEFPSSLIAGFTTSGNFATARLAVNPKALGKLQLVPVTALSGETSSGRPLFAIELMRLGDQVELRTVLRDANGSSMPGAWQSVDLSQGYLEFAWQASAAERPDGYFMLSVGNATVALPNHSDTAAPARMRVGLVNGQPWMQLQ